MNFSIPQHNINSEWGRVTHIHVGKLTFIGSDNGLSPGRRQASIWTTAGILLFGPSGSNFSEILIEIDTFSLKMQSKTVVCEMAAIISRSQCVHTGSTICTPDSGAMGKETVRMSEKMNVDAMFGIAIEFQPRDMWRVSIKLYTMQNLVRICHSYTRLMQGDIRIKQWKLIHVMKH